MYRQEIAYQIAGFGDEFVYYTNNSNLAIAAVALREFRKLTLESVIWNHQPSWRFKESGESTDRLSDVYYY